jgi:hypothetical protein
MSLSNDDIKQLIAILQRGLSSDEQTEIIEKETKTSKPRKKRKKAVDTDAISDTIDQDEGHSGIETIKTKKTKLGFKNKFLEMPESNMHKEDIAFDKRVSKFPPTPRNRSFGYLQVKCRVCGKTEKVSPSLVDSMERYKCNKCCTMPG